MAGLYSRPHTPPVSGVGEGGREGKLAAATSKARVAKRLAVRAAGVVNPSASATS